MTEKPQRQPYEQCNVHTYSQRKYFDKSTRQLYCEHCVIDNKLDFPKLLDIETYADELYDKWTKMTNWTKYLSHEHDQKEKEYGIPWRSAFKKEINFYINELRLKLYGYAETQEREDPFIVLQELLKEARNQVEQYYIANQIDVMEALREREDFFESRMIYLKKILKEPDLHKFDEVKKNIIH